jgi:DNA-binding LytR/AlgR family response regulator
MTFSCLIIDDEPIARAIVRDYCTQLGFFNIVAECENVFKAMPFLQHSSIDLLFLDINMPGMTGLDFLRTLIHPPNVILTTAYQEFALESYDLGVKDYLLKPFSLSRFTRAVQRALPQSMEEASLSSTPSKPSKLTIKCEGKILFLDPEDLLFCEAQGNYTRIVTTEQSYLPYTPLYKIEEQLPSDFFRRIHRSFIINLSKITGIDGNHALVHEERIPIGQQFKDDFFQYWGLK